MSLFRGSASRCSPMPLLGSGTKQALRHLPRGVVGGSLGSFAGVYAAVAGEQSRQDRRAVGAVRYAGETYRQRGTGGRGRSAQPLLFRSARP